MHCDVHLAMKCHGNLGEPSLPSNQRRSLRPGEKGRVVRFWHMRFPVKSIELEVPDQGANDRAEVDVGELLAYASVTTDTKGQVRALDSLADLSVPVVYRALVCFNLDPSFPTVRVPDIGLGKEFLTQMRHDGRSDHVVVRRDNVVSFGDRQGLHNLSHDRVDGAVNSQRLLDDVLQQRKLVDIGILEWLGPVVAEVPHLLLVELFHDVRPRGQAEHDP